MKVLIYNWTQFDDAQGRGGGVSVYLRNIIPELLARENVDITFIGSGQHFDVLKRRPYVQKTKNMFSADGVKSYRIINSTIKAPAHDAFASISKWRTDAVTYRVMKDFISQHGPFDALHIHSLEGISAHIMALQTAFPEMKVIYTLHNYMPYCPQIELLYQNEKFCEDFMDGTKCIGCLNGKRSMNAIIRRERLGSTLVRNGFAGRPIGNFAFGSFMGLLQLGNAVRYLALDFKAGIKKRFKNWSRKRELPGKWEPINLEDRSSVPHLGNLDGLSAEAKEFAEWRRTNSTILSKQVDLVFAVSNLVRQTVQRIGEDIDNIVPLPLAMDLHRSPQQMLEAFDSKTDKSEVTISFIGYSIASKGLPFLLQTFEDFDNEFLRENVRLIIVCRTNAHLRRRLLKLTKRFKRVEIIEGYQRPELPALAHQIDLNIVPSIWPETFNQVTYEMMALGTPSLTSDFVGASELFSQPKTFTYQNASATDFQEKLLRLVKSRDLRRSFFDDLAPLPTLSWHVDQLMGAYDGTLDRDALLGRYDIDA